MTSSGQRHLRDAASSPWEGLGDSSRGKGSPAAFSAACSPQNKNHPVKHQKQFEKHASRQSETIQRSQSCLFQPSGSLTQQLTQSLEEKTVCGRRKA